MDTDEGPLINENSNGLSHLLTEGEFNSVDAGAVDESSTSNQGFLNAVELSAGSVGDYLENNANGFNADSFDVGDNAVTFPSDSLNTVLSDGDSRLSEAVYKNTSEPEGDGECTNSQKMKAETDDDQDIGKEITNDGSLTVQQESTKELKIEETNSSNFDSTACENSNDMSQSNEKPKVMIIFMSLFSGSEILKIINRCNFL